MVAKTYGYNGVPPTKGVKGTKRYAMAVDLRRCTGCNACTAACKTAYDVPLGDWRIWVSEAETGEYPKTKRHVLPRMCNQCDQPSCVRNCPTKATFKHPDGFVLQRYNRCIGCRTCMVACPYNARHLLTEHRRDSRNPRAVADKCDFCIVRVTRGLAPLCVTSCTGGAMIFGDINDPDSEVSRVVAANNTFNLRPEQGNAPQVYYIGLTQEIADPDFAFLHRSKQLHNRYNTFKTNSELGAELAGNIIDTEEATTFFGITGQFINNMVGFVKTIPHKMLKGLF